jgi:hypothetical protein
MSQLTEREFIDRFLKRVYKVHPDAEPTDLFEYAINNAAYSDMGPEEAAEVFAANIEGHWLSIGRRPIPKRTRKARRTERLRYK